MALEDVGQGTGIVSGERYLPASELAQRSARGAAALHDLGVWQGDRVALLLRNDLAFFEATSAAAKLGASTIPLNWHMTAAEIDYILDNSAAKAVLVHADLLTEAVLAACTGREVIVVDTPPDIAALYGRREPTPLAAALPRWDDLVRGFAPWEREPRRRALPMFYTSGTTGRPKGVERLPIGPEAMAAVQHRSAVAFGLQQPKIRSVMTGPLYHSAPHAYGMEVIARGGLLVLQPRFDPLDLLRLVERYRITNLHMVPTMFVRLLGLSAAEKARYDLSSLRNVVHGAAACPMDVKRAMIEWWGPVINEYYAMTETGFIACSTSEDWLRHPGTVGRAAPGVTIEIRDDHDQPCAAGEVGEICVRSEVTGHVAYHRDASKTDALRRGDFVATGDVGHVDAEGYLFISDRKTDMVISGGVNIYPAEVEQELIMLEGVGDCAVFGIPHAEFGEQLVGVIQLKPAASLTEEEVRDFLRDRVAGYKIPRLIRFADDLPREDSGKIMKRKLRAKLFA